MQPFTNHSVLGLGAPNLPRHQRIDCRSSVKLRQPLFSLPGLHLLEKSKAGCSDTAPVFWNDNYTIQSVRAANGRNYEDFVRGGMTSSASPQLIKKGEIEQTIRF
jgi:hypothetical protein